MSSLFMRNSLPYFQIAFTRASKTGGLSVLQRVLYLKIDSKNKNRPLNVKKSHKSVVKPSKHAQNPSFQSTKLSYYNDRADNITLTTNSWSR